MERQRGRGQAKGSRRGRSARESSRGRAESSHPASGSFLPRVRLRRAARLTGERAGRPSWLRASTSGSSKGRTRKPQMDATAGAESGADRRPGREERRRKESRGRRSPSGQRRGARMMSGGEGRAGKGGLRDVCDPEETQPEGGRGGAEGVKEMRSIVCCRAADRGSKRATKNITPNAQAGGQSRWRQGERGEENDERKLLEESGGKARRGESGGGSEKEKERTDWCASRSARRCEDRRAGGGADLSRQAFLPPLLRTGSDTTPTFLWQPKSSSGAEPRYMGKTKRGAGGRGHWRPGVSDVEQTRRRRGLGDEENEWGRPRGGDGATTPTRSGAPRVWATRRWRRDAKNGLDCSAGSAASRRRRRDRASAKGSVFWKRGDEPWGPQMLSLWHEDGPGRDANAAAMVRRLPGGAKMRS